MKHYLNAGEIARLEGIGKATVTRYIKDGVCSNNGRYRREKYGKHHPEASPLGIVRFEHRDIGEIFGITSFTEIRRRR